MDVDDIRDLLREVEDPDLGDDIVSLNLVNDVEIDGETVHVDLALGAPFAPHEMEIADRVREVLEAEGLEPELSASVDRGVSAEEDVLPNVTNIVAVASGKGGVGKSTIAVNVAAGLAERGVTLAVPDVPDIRSLYRSRPRATTRTGYLRLHSRNADYWYADDKDRYDYDYSDAELQDVADAWTALDGEVDRVYAFFNNCHGGQAARNAESFRRIVEAT